MDERLAPDRFWATLTKALDNVAEHARTPPPDARVGAVLVLLHDGPDGPVVVLTRRRADLRSHPGQISFAGGRLDEGETIVEAALREAEEEIGVGPQGIDVIGVGPTFYIPPSRFWVVPVVARWVSPTPTNPNPWEVDEVLHVPLADLLDPSRWRKVPLSHSGASWAWQLDDDLLWGATAVVTALLLEVAVPGWNQGVDPSDLSDDLARFPWDDAPTVERAARLDGDLPEVAQADVAHVTADQMRAVDAALDKLGIRLEHVVEHAGRALTHAARRLLDGDLAGRTVTVLAGSGGNGAGGLAGARLLLAAGAHVRVVLVGGGQPLRLPRQLEALAPQRSSAHVVRPDVVTVERASDLDGLEPGDLVIDAMVGYAADPPLRGPAADANAWLVRHRVPVISLDLPSGMSADIGLRGTCVTADVTVTIAAPKIGMRQRITHAYLGDVYVADIGVPPSVWLEVGVEQPELFGRGPLVRMRIEEAGSDAATPDQGSAGRGLRSRP